MFGRAWTICVLPLSGTCALGVETLGSGKGDELCSDTIPYVGTNWGPSGGLGLEMGLVFLKVSFASNLSQSTGAGYGSVGLAFGSKTALNLSKNSPTSINRIFSASGPLRFSRVAWKVSRSRNCIFL